MAPKAKCIKKENFHNFHITPNTSLPAILHVLYVLRSRIRRWCAMLTGAKFDWLTDWLIDWLIDWSALFVIQTLALSDARIATWRRTCAISESEMMISCSESQRLTYISIDWLIDCLIDWRTSSFAFTCRCILSSSYGVRTMATCVQAALMVERWKGVAGKLEILSHFPIFYKFSTAFKCCVDYK